MALVTAIQVSEITSQRKGFDVALIEKHILEAEWKYIKPFLGDTLFNTLGTENTSGTFTSSNETLLNEYVRPALAWWTMYEALPQIHVQLSSAGLQKNSTEFSTAVSGGEFGTFRQSIASSAEVAMERMREYLNDNSTTFTTWSMSKSGTGNTLPLLY